MELIAIRAIGTGKPNSPVLPRRGGTFRNENEPKCVYNLQTNRAKSGKVKNQTGGVPKFQRYKLGFSPSGSKLNDPTFFRIYIQNTVMFRNLTFVRKHGIPQRYSLDISELRISQCVLALCTPDASDGRIVSMLNSDIGREGRFWRMLRRCFPPTCVTRQILVWVL